MTISFAGRAKRLEDIDLPRIGHEIGVGEDEIHAVIDVEAAGSGFDSKGRVKALYEPHIAYARSKGETRDLLAKAGLAYPKWGSAPYPKDSYPRILQAYEIAGDVALLSTSWGLGQIMGFNHAAAGFKSPKQMIEAFADDEDNHLEAMISFIKVNGLDDEIRRHDWAGFARGYNGPGYRQNQYDTKLAAAFAKWRKIKDTPWSPGQGEDVAHPAKPIPAGGVIYPVEPAPASAPTYPYQAPPSVTTAMATKPEPEIVVPKLPEAQKRVGWGGMIIAAMTALFGKRG